MDYHMDEKKGDVSQATLRASDIKEVPQAPLTLTMWAGVVLAAVQSLNYGLGIGVVNLSATTVRKHFNIEGDDNEATWGLVASLMAVGGIIGGLIGGPMCTKLGPKRTLLANNLFLVITVALQSAATNIGMLMAGRVFTGIAAGILCAAVPMWVSEASPTHVRGAFGVAHQLAITIGILLINLLGMNSVWGNEDNWRILYGAFLAPAIIHFVGFLFIPDSPRFLYFSGDIAGAETSLRRLRGPDYNIEYELEALRREKAAEDEAGALSMVQAVRAIFTPAYSRQTIVGIGLQVAQQASGINAIMFYSGQIFEDAGFEDSELATIILCVINVVVTIAAIPLIERAGRRALALGGFGAMGLSLGLFGVSAVVGWNIPSVVFMLLGVISFAVGPGPVPWMITSEIYDAKVRPGAVGVCVFINWVVTFIVGMVFGPLQSALESYTFFVFCGICLAITVFVYFCVPETKGKSFAQIQTMFAGSRSHDSLSA